VAQAVKKYLCVDMRQFENHALIEGPRRFKMKFRFVVVLVSIHNVACPDGRKWQNDSWELAVCQTMCVAE